MTIYEALKARLNREPTHAEIKAEVQRILDEALIDAARLDKHPYIRQNRLTQTLESKK